MSAATETPDSTPFRGVIDIADAQTGLGPTIYVYEAPVRLWHWVNALCVVVLIVTGFLIGAPPPTLTGEASAHFEFGYIRFAHFAAGQVLAVFFLMRIYWACMGNRHARQIFYLPIWNCDLVEGRVVGSEMVCLPDPEPKKYVGHNPLAQIAMFFTVTLGTIGMIITGFALYSEGAGRDCWQAALFGWVFTIFPNPQDVHTLHHLGLWVIVMFHHRACVCGGARGDHVAADNDRDDDFRLAAVP